MIIAKLTGLSEGLSGLVNAKNVSAYRKSPVHGGYYLKYQEEPLHNAFSFYIILFCSQFKEIPQSSQRRQLGALQTKVL